MNPMRNWKNVAALAVLASTVSCGDVVRQGRGPNFLIIDSLQGSRGGGTSFTGGPLLSDVQTGANGAIVNDTGQVVLRLVPKDVATTGVSNAPSSNNDVTINRFRVVYRRTDGRNVQGVDVPYSFEAATTATVRANGTAPVVFELVRHVAKAESPLIQLKTNLVVITTIGDVTFYGRDQVGNDISATGSIQINFADFAD
jgi:hypothetical protein